MHSTAIIHANAFTVVCDSLEVIVYVDVKLSFLQTCKSLFTPSIMAHGRLDGILLDQRSSVAADFTTESDIAVSMCSSCVKVSSLLRIVYFALLTI